MSSEKRTPYERGDFISKCYLGWAASDEHRLLAALRMGADLESAMVARAETSRQFSIEVPDTIAISLTTACNRRCRFCGASKEVLGPTHTLEKKALVDILHECVDLGISRIVLVGGEPLMHPMITDVIQDFPNLFFLVFTNGDLLDDTKLRFFSHRVNYALAINVTEAEQPVMGLQRETRNLFEQLKRHRLFFGYSATVYRDNARTFEHPDVYGKMADLGGHFGMLFDYLPDFDQLADDMRVSPMQRRRIIEVASAAALKNHTTILFAPEDENIDGGCAAAGRSILHVSANGGITPCPFVPYAALSIRSHGLLDALRSEYFTELRARAKNWNRCDETCAFRAHATEFQTINASHQVRRIS